MVQGYVQVEAQSIVRQMFESWLLELFVSPFGAGMLAHLFEAAEHLKLALAQYLGLVLYLVLGHLSVLSDFCLLFALARMVGDIQKTTYPLSLHLCEHLSTGHSHVHSIDAP